MLKKTLAAAVALAASTSAFADAHHEFSYDYVEAGVGIIKADESILDSQTMVFAGSKTVGHNVFVLGGYEASETKDKIDAGVGTPDEVSVSGFSIGAGYHMPVAVPAYAMPYIDKADVVFTVAQTFGEVEYQDFEEDVDATTITAGLRTMMGHKVETEATVRHITGDVESDTSLTLNARYEVSEGVDLGVALNILGDAADTYVATARYSF